jgi:RNA polymerase sigma factor for flagellar operon FliA
MGTSEEQIHWIFNIARRMRRQLPPVVEPGDLIGDGFIGLSRAIDRFNPSRDIPFKAFAIRMIQFAIRDGLRQRDPLPRRIRHGECPPRFRDVHSIPLAAPPPPDYLEIAEVVAHALNQIPPRPRRVLELYYLHEWTMKQIADAMGITESAVSQMRTRRSKTKG